MLRSLVAVLVGVMAASLAEGAGVGPARELFKAGKYAEALEAFEAVGKAEPASRDAAAIGRADCLESTGEPDKAVAALREVAEPAGDAKENPDVWARLADIQFSRGDWEGAEASFLRALKGKPDHLLGRWTQARLLEARGLRPEADAACKWFVDYQNLHAAEVEKDAAALLLIGQASERYIRANMTGDDLAEELNKLINNVYEVAIKADPQCWQACWLEGRLFLAGYQEGDARKELTKALRINPHSPEVLVTLGQADLQGYKLALGRKKADRALEINPGMAAARVLLADLNISDERFLDARDKATRKAVAENPRDEDNARPTGRRGPACWSTRWGPRRSSRSMLGVQPPPGQRSTPRSPSGWPTAASISLGRAGLPPVDRRRPDNRPDTRIGLGMLYMQVGREPEARDLFEAAFKPPTPSTSAPRTCGLILKVTWPAYRADRHRALHRPGRPIAQDMPSSPSYMGQLPRVDPRRAGQELRLRAVPAVTQIEIMKDHEKFSGRTVALPFIPTVGACTGKVVALSSPRTSPRARSTGPG